MSFDATDDDMLQSGFGAAGAPAHDATPPADTRQDEVATSVYAAVEGTDGAAADGVATTDSPPPERPAGRRQGPGGRGTRGAEGLGLAAVGGPTGRFRNAVTVGATGLTCAAIGAFLGGLGAHGGSGVSGLVTVHPSTAHASSGSSGYPTPAATASPAAGAVAPHHRSAEDIASFSALSGGLTRAIERFGWLTTIGTTIVPAFGIEGPGLASLGPARGSAPGSSAAGGVTTEAADPSVATDPTFAGPDSSQDGDVAVAATGTPSDPGAVAAAGSIPATATGSVPGPASPAALATSLSGALDPVVDVVTTAAGGGSGLAVPPALPGGGSSETLPPPSATVTPTATTPPAVAGTATEPLPALPVPSSPPVSVGGTPVGVTSSSSGSGLSLSLP
jgi:hypothetical protein